MRRFRVVFVAGSFVLLLAVACGGAGVRTPAYTKQPTSALQQVPYPPPPARVEQIPVVSDKAAVWLDGEWTWQGTTWSWKRGRWVVPPKDAAYAPWTATRDVQGTLYVAPGSWRDAKGGEVPEPQALIAAKPVGGTVVDTGGDPVQSGPNVRVDARIDNAADSGLPPSDAAVQDAGFDLDASFTLDATAPTPTTMDAGS